VGVGKKGVSLYPVDDPIFGRRYVPMQNELDENSLQQIATITKGTYHRATDTDSLTRIYQDIDRMEKTKIETETTVEYHEQFRPFLMLGVVLLLIEAFLSNSVFRRIA
jgi:Ca-activated chloride channel homolog